MIPVVLVHVGEMIFMVKCVYTVNSTCFLQGMGTVVGSEVPVVQFNVGELILWSVSDAPHRYFRFRASSGSFLVVVLMLMVQFIVGEMIGSVKFQIFLLILKLGDGGQ